MLESLLLALLGALVGIVLMLPFNGMTDRHVERGDLQRSGVCACALRRQVVMTAIIFALIMGFVGGLAPAWHAARQNILTALAGIA